MCRADPSSTEDMIPGENKLAKSLTESDSHSKAETARQPIIDVKDMFKGVWLVEGHDTDDKMRTNTAERREVTAMQPGSIPDSILLFFSLCPLTSMHKEFCYND